MSSLPFNEDILRDLLPLYYRRLFPFRPYYKWLSYGNVKPQYFLHREFSFTLADDVYFRYNSFKDQKELEEAIQKRNPYKIDIGAVFSSQPKEHRKDSNMHPVEKELVFDIDMTDYDEVRTCCQGADVCTKCWKYMSIACKVLDVALKDDFGFEHLLWVFSGRRGIHCWVCDESARSLDNSSRASIADYLSVLSGGDNQAKKVKIDGDKMHHSIRRAKNIIEQQFVTMCVEEQDMLGTPQRIAKVLALLPEEAQVKELEKQMKDLTTSSERWSALVDHVNGLLDKGQLKKWRRFLVDEIMLQYAYPRLDINVSKGLNHLLKSPFCIHPKTGKVCVPFNPKTVDKFNPHSVPTLPQLVDEVKEYDEKEKHFDDKEKENGTDSVPNAGEEKKVVENFRDFKKTSMYKSVVIFEEFVKNLEMSRKSKKLEANDMKMEF